MKKSLVALRAEWLARQQKQNKRFTLQNFACATGEYIGTVQTWFKTNRVPRRRSLDAVLLVYPDWPH